MSGPQLKNVFVQTLGNQFHAVRRKQWTVGRALKNASVFTTQRTETCLSARVQSVEFVISRALPLFCSGSLSGNQTSFSASRPCWNSVTEINVYRVFLVSNLMVFSFVLFCLRPSPFFSFSVECVS